MPRSTSPLRSREMSARRLLRAGIRRAAAIAGHHLPERTLARLVAARAWRGGVAVGLPRFKRALVLAPHPDDESLSAGGTLAMLSSAGTAITLVAVTDGEASLSAGIPAAELAQRRRRELEMAAAQLGVTEVRFLGHPDTGLHEVRGLLAAELGALLASVRPNVVILPWAGDDPGDHAALNLALSDAGVPADVEVWGGEVWTPLPANRIVDISVAMDRKRAALAAHVTASGAFDLSAVLGLNRYRSVKGLRGRGYAEAFLTCSGDRYADLVAAALGDAPAQR